MIVLPYSTLNFAYTLDDTKMLQFSTENDDTYFTVKMVVKSYSFYEGIETVKTLDYKIPLYNKEAEFNVGRIIHRVMDTISDLNSQELQYKTTVVGFTIYERNVADNLAVGSAFIQSNLNFIAGIKPFIYNEHALLDSNNFASRITPNGFKHISFCIPAGERTIMVLKNNVTVKETSQTISGGENVRTFKYDFKEFNAAPGDVFEVAIKNTTIAKTVVIFPEQRHSKVILFEDEFKLVNSIECTGGYSTPTEYTQITHSYKRNLVEVLEIIETTKVNSLIINTGWLLKTDNITIDSLFRSKKAWLFLTENETIELVPVAKKLTNIDSDNDLYQYDLEFKINRTYDAQNYTF